jgi:ABC-type transport system substrate-binding protein
MKRKSFNALTLLVVFSMMLAACAPAATPTPQVITKVETQVVKETQIVKETVVIEPTAAPTEPPPVTYERNETLYISGAAWGPVSDWNPLITWSNANASASVGLIYETLFMFSPLTGEMIPFLAESGEWSDADTYELTLREGLTWQDGQPLTAADVAFTYEMAKEFALGYSDTWTVEGLHSTCYSNSSIPCTRRGQTPSGMTRSFPSTSGRTERKRRSPAEPTRILLVRGHTCTTRTAKTEMCG